jgi:hypothetical protein
MKTKSSNWMLACLLAGAVAFVTSAGTAEGKKMENPPAERKSPAQRAIPFRGKITALDQTALTVTVGTRVFQITSETKIFKGEAAGTFSDASVGMNASGSYHEAGGGKLVAKMIRFGPKPETGDKQAAPKPAPESDAARKKKSS